MSGTGQPSARAYLLMSAAFAVQNLEETLFLPAWLARHLPDMPTPSHAHYALATGLLTLLVAAICVRASRPGPPIATYWLPALTAGALLSNALFHLIASALTLSLMPGAISGLLLQGPSAGLVLTRLSLSRRNALLFCCAGLALTAPLAAGSLFIARYLLSGASP